MCQRITDFRNKQVVSVKDGSVIGYVWDIEINTETGTVCSVIVLGRPRFFGLFGREEDIVIPWCDIKVIGQETILVSYEAPVALNSKKRFF